MCFSRNVQNRSVSSEANGWALEILWLEDSVQWRSVRDQNGSLTWPLHSSTDAFVSRPKDAATCRGTALKSPNGRWARDPSGDFCLLRSRTPSNEWQEIKSLA
ncbi:hypothetical protein CEXT_658061 [Caerostris extrusa]|uniref:Uncharacterized protein n=1 Tax=Caerostris extrusa TaxID=172846 RepID=A0AAV4XIL5_CAEEX|nr:hypothetical protein CEXT_658061 [Caerostris extrusa]